MILTYLHVSIAYDRLRRILQTMPIGTFFRNVRHLESALGLAVTVGYGSPDTLRTYLEAGLPLIASVNTKMFAHWNYQETIHAVVVVGINDDLIYINDPAADQAPLALDRIEFEAAWIEENELYAVISLTEPEPAK